jgi:S1-C subfamily serine protease
MKKLFIALILLFLITTTSFAAKDDSAVKIFSISAEDFGGCSGVIVKNDKDVCIILTAKHCLNTHEEIYVEDKPVQLIIASKDDDLTILIVEGNIPDKKAVTIAEYNQTIGDQAYHVGYSNNTLYEPTGTLTRFTKDWVFYDMYAKPGCSGGGIFNDKNELVGILWGGLTFQDVTIAEPLKDIKRFLKEIQTYTPYLIESKQ